MEGCVDWATQKHHSTHSINRHVDWVDWLGYSEGPYHPMGRSMGRMAEWIGLLRRTKHPMADRSTDGCIDEGPPKDPQHRTDGPNRRAHGLGYSLTIL